jgi:hypothetical protein
MAPQMPVHTQPQEENVSKAPPTPEVPEGYKAIWHYKEFYYANIYTRQSEWEKPTEPVYPHNVVDYTGYFDGLADVVSELPPLQMPNKKVAAQENKKQTINDAILPNMTTNQQQSFQVPLQHSQQPQEDPALTEKGQAVVAELAERLMSRASAQKRNEVRLDMERIIDPIDFNRNIQQSRDPVADFYHHLALNRFREHKRGRLLEDT